MATKKEETKIIKVDEIKLTEAELKEIEEKGGNKKEKKERVDLKRHLKFFEQFKTEEEAKEHIKNNIVKVKITKGLMSAYMRTYDEAGDKKWFEEAALVKNVQKYRYTVCVDENGNGLTKTNKKGQTIPRKKRVAINETFDKARYDHTKARAKFLEHYKIEVKPVDFTPKAKRNEEDYYNIFEGLF